MKILHHPFLKPNIHHLLSCLWFLSPGDRRSGRTTVLAAAAIVSAYQNPGQLIYILDHHPGESKNRHTFDIVRDMISVFPHDSYEMHRNQGTLRVVPGTRVEGLDMKSISILAFKGMIARLQESGLELDDILLIVKSQFIQKVMSE